MATRDAAAANRAAAAKRASSPAGPNRSRLPLIVAAVVVVCAAIAIGASVALDGGGGNGVVEDRAADVQVTGEPLPAYLEGADDLAEGREFPSVTGTAADGQPLTIQGGDGPMLVVYLAHWCPVCQEEVPVIVDWAANGGAEDVEIRGISTSFARERGNWPSTEWLDEEGWDFPTLLDPDGSASLAAGQARFPFVVAVNDRGEVVARVEGALGPDQLDVLVEAVQS